MPRIATVWGACGFIGRHLVTHLLQSGHIVRALTRGREIYPPPSWADRVEWFELRNTALDAAVMTAAIGGCDTVYNLAGSSGAVQSNRSPLTSLDTICRAELDFLAACERARSIPRVVFASSRLVYGRTAPHTTQSSVAEDAALAPASMYAVHKACVENYHHIYAQRGVIRSTVCRVTNPFGADPASGRKSYGFLNWLIQRGLDGQPLPIYGDGSQLRDYLHISDLVRGLMLAGTLPAAENQIFNLGRGEGIRLREAAEVVRRLTSGGLIEYLPWPEEHALVESGDFVADISKAARLLGFQPAVSFERGIAETVEGERHSLGELVPVDSQTHSTTQKVKGLAQYA